MSSILSFVSIIASVISICSCFALHQSSNLKPNGFSSRLINRNSINSPFHTPNLTRSDRISISMKYSYARHDYIQNLRSTKVSTNNIGTPVWPAENAYVMEYYIGTPPIRTYAIIDTGSAVLWLQCLPCTCYKQTKVSIFDPAKSSTYRRLACKEYRCQDIDQSFCNKENNCQYLLRYQDKSYTYGDVAEDTLIFHDGNKNNTVEHVVFGCGHQNFIYMVREGVPGIIGLIASRGSIVSQLSYEKFAYCLGDFDEIEAYGYVKFGDAAHITGYKTPMQFVGPDTYPFYYLNLEGISVDEKYLLIPNGTFSLTEDDENGLIIDSGTEYTFLKDTGYNILVEELKQKLQNLKKVTDPNKIFDQCYEFGLVDIRHAPVIILHFTGADLQLPLLNTWLQVKGNIHCLAMVPTAKTSILGHFQQQNHKVGYDLESRQVSFDFTICADD